MLGDALAGLGFYSVVNNDSHMAMSPGWDNGLSELSLLNTCEEGTVITRVRSRNVWPNATCLCGPVLSSVLESFLRSCPRCRRRSRQHTHLGQDEVGSLEKGQDMRWPLESCRSFLSRFMGWDGCQWGSVRCNCPQLKVPPTHHSVSAQEEPFIWLLTMIYVERLTLLF